MLGAVEINIGMKEGFKNEVTYIHKFMAASPMGVRGNYITPRVTTLSHHSLPSRSLTSKYMGILSTYFALYLLYFRITSNLAFSSRRNKHKRLWNKVQSTKSFGIQAII